MVGKKVLMERILLNIVATLDVTAIVCICSLHIRIKASNALNGTSFHYIKGSHLTRLVSQEVFSVERYLQDHEHFHQHQLYEVEDIFPLS
jgi:hypothetical protein